MTTFRITHKKSLRDPKKWGRIQARGVRSAIKTVYIRRRADEFTPGRGHRFPPEKFGDVEIIGTRTVTRSGRTFKVFDVGQPREDGVITHRREITALVS